MLLTGHVDAQIHVIEDNKLLIVAKMGSKHMEKVLLLFRVDIMTIPILEQRDVYPLSRSLLVSHPF